MRKIYILLWLVVLAGFASAQDYTLKNYTDHFSILQNGQGINIIGNNITDNQGVYFLKGTSNAFLKIADTTGNHPNVISYTFFNTHRSVASNQRMDSLFALTVRLSAANTFTNTNTFNGSTVFGGNVTVSNFLYIPNTTNNAVLYNGGGILQESTGLFQGATTKLMTGWYGEAAYAVAMFNSNTQGVIFPQVTQGNRNAINLSPNGNPTYSYGLQVFQPDGTPGQYVNLDGTWQRFLTTGDIPSFTGKYDIYDGEDSQDFNATLTPGFMTVDNDGGTITNSPLGTMGPDTGPNGQNWAIINQKSYGTRMQLTTMVNGVTSDLWFRGGAGNSFYSWRKIWDSTNLDPSTLATNTGVLHTTGNETKTGNLAITGELTSSVAPVNPNDVVRLQDLTSLGGSPSGAAGGDLAGTYPNPTVSTINGITKSYYDPTSSIQTQLNSKASLTANQTFTGSNIFSKDIKVNSVNIGLGASSVATNTAVGAGSLQANTSGGYNTALGYATLQSNTTGTSNVALGATALDNNTTGGSNVAIGMQTLAGNISGNSNTAVGTGSLSVNTTGNGSTGVGAGSLQQNTTGTANTGVGTGALQSNNTGSYNTAIGGSSLQGNTSGSNNTAIGYWSLAANSTGTSNIAIGYYSQPSNSTGSGNISMGNISMANNSTGGNNTALGTNAMQGNTTGGTNTAVGMYSLQGNSTGNNNVAIGNQAMQGAGTGGNNVVIGSGAGQNIGNGGGNVFLGYMAGYNITGNNKLWIANSNTTTPLLQGDFSAGTLIINGKLSSTIAPTNPNDVVRLQDLSSGAGVSGTAGGDLTGTYPNPTVHTVNGVTTSYYDVTSSIQTQLNAKATDANLVHITGSETVTGSKTFTGNLLFGQSGSLIQFPALNLATSPLVTDGSGYLSQKRNVIFNTGLNINDPSTNTYPILVSDINGTQIRPITQSAMQAISPAAPYQFDGHIVYQTDQTSKGYYVYVSNYNNGNAGSFKKVIIGDANGNIVMTNKITTSTGVDVFKTGTGNWIYYTYNDDGTTTVHTATVSIDGNNNATVTLN